MFKVGDKVRVTKRDLSDWGIPEDLTNKTHRVRHTLENGCMIDGGWYVPFMHLKNENPSELDLWRSEFPHLKGYIKMLMRR